MDDETRPDSSLADRRADARYPLARNDVVATPIDAEVLLYDPADGSTHALNHTAAAVWTRCDGTRSPTMIAADLARQFDLPSGYADGDVDRLVDRLHDLHLVRFVPPPAP